MVYLYIHKASKPTHKPQFITKILFVVIAIMLVLDSIPFFGEYYVEQQIFVSFLSLLCYGKL